jgi:hypothetical protein
MAPIWLVRLNNLLAWLNPVLCMVAWVLAALVVAVAAERLPGHAASPVMQAARPTQTATAVACPPLVPPELQELRLYD